MFLKLRYSPLNALRANLSLACGLIIYMKMILLQSVKLLYFALNAFLLGNVSIVLLYERKWRGSNMAI